MTKVTPFLMFNDQLEQAIREPIQKVGAAIDDQLVQRLLIDVEDQTDRLPLLQHACCARCDSRICRANETTHFVQGRKRNSVSTQYVKR